MKKSESIATIYLSFLDPSSPQWGHNPYSTRETSQATKHLVSDSTKQTNNNLMKALNQGPLRLQEELGSQTMEQGETQRDKEKS